MLARASTRSVSRSTSSKSAVLGLSCRALERLLPPSKPRGLRRWGAGGRGTELSVREAAIAYRWWTWFCAASGAVGPRGRPPLGPDPSGGPMWIVNSQAELARTSHGGVAMTNRRAASCGPAVINAAAYAAVAMFLAGISRKNSHRVNRAQMTLQQLRASHITAALCFCPSARLRR